MDPVASFYQAIPDLAREMWGYLDPLGAKGLGMTHNALESGILIKRYDDGLLEGCFVRLNSSVSFYSPLPASVPFIGPWAEPKTIVPMIKEHRMHLTAAAPSSLSVNAVAFESCSVKPTGWDNANPSPSLYPHRSPIASLTPIKPTGWGDDAIDATPNAGSYTNGTNGYGYNHDDRNTITPPSGWIQTPWVKKPSSSSLAAVTHQSSGSGASGEKTISISQWESSPPLTEASATSPFNINAGKMGGDQGGEGEGDNNKAPALPLEDRLFKCGCADKEKWPRWYYIDQMDPSKTLYGPFDAPLMISLYLTQSLGPSIYLVGLDPMIPLEPSTMPPKSLFRPLPQLERLCLSDGEGSGEGFRVYTAIDEHRLQETNRRYQLLGREPPPEVFAAFTQHSATDNREGYERDQDVTREDSGYEEDGEQEMAKEEEQARVSTEPATVATAGEVGNNWGKDWGA
jgi:hypothetical protein